MPLQCGTQWDALSHVFYDGRMYNDRDVKLVTSQGARANAIEKIADGVVGRGVLLDLPRFLRRPWLDDGTRILPEDLDACAEAFGVAIGSGDIVLVRTGMMTRCLEQKSWEGYCARPRAGPLDPLRALALRARDRGGGDRHLGRRGAAQRDARLLPAPAHDLAAQHGPAARRDLLPRRARRAPAPRTAATSSCSRRRRFRSPAPSGSPINPLAIK